MFENIIGQQRIVAQLKDVLQGEQLPNSLLITGPRFSGKMTVALEIARVLSCRGKGEWGCTCGSCARNRLLVNDHVVFLGSRYFTSEVAASAEVYRRNEADFARFILLRAIRKCTRRFDPFLWSGDEQKVRPIASGIESLEEFAESIMPGYPRPEQLEDDLKKMKATMTKLGIEARLNSISVDQVRNLRSWCHESGTGNKKIVIIENAHSLTASAANALLKILEEPPKDVYFLLIAERDAGIPVTILSRLRKYELEARSGAEQQRVLTRIFRLEEGEYESIDQYLLAWKTDISSFTSHATQFMDAVLMKQEARREMFREMFEPLRERDMFNSFLAEIQKKGKDKSGEVDLSTQEEWNKLIHQTKLMREMYNQNPVSLGESLYFRMRNTV